MDVRHLPAGLYCHPFQGLRPPRAHPPVPLCPPLLWDQQHQHHPDEIHQTTVMLASFSSVLNWSESTQFLLVKLNLLHSSIYFSFPARLNEQTKFMCVVMEKCRFAAAGADVPLILWLLFVQTDPFCLSDPSEREKCLKGEKRNDH